MKRLTLAKEGKALPAPPKLPRPSRDDLSAVIKKYNEEALGIYRGNMMYCCDWCGRKFSENDKLAKHKANCKDPEVKEKKPHNPRMPTDEVCNNAAQ